MKIEVSVVTMNQEDESLIEKMNLQTDVVIGNQCDRNEVVKNCKNGHRYSIYSFAERGVGLNRNNILFRSEAEIITFADDDMVFFDGYAEIILKAFSELPDADAIVFNIKVNGTDSGRKGVRRENRKIRRVRWWNFMNYGICRVSIKNSSIKRTNISFHREFGGGTRYSAGEDTLFLTDMMKKKLKIYTYPVCIACINQNNSTWFKGYNEKFFYDRGALYQAMTSKFASILSFIMVVKNWNIYKASGYSFGKILKLMKNGRNGFRNLKSYDE